MKKLFKIFTPLFVLAFIFQITNSQVTQNLQTHIKYLASDELEGRFPGTDGIAKARDYIAEQFKNTGLKSFSGDYLQKLNVTIGYKLGEGNEVYFDVIIPKPGVPLDKVKPIKKPWEVGKDWLPLSFSENSQISAPMVFCGFGITAKELNYDDYEGIDVKNKVAIILSNSPDKDKEDGRFANYLSYHYKIRNAREKGAIGVIIVKIQGDSANVFVPLERDRFAQNSGLVAIQANRTRIAEYFPGNSLYPTELEIYRTQKPKSFEIPNATINIKVNLEENKVPSENVVGWVEGIDPQLKNEYIVVGAHYDHLGWGGPTSNYKGKKPMIHNGADDNASGVAALIELAKVIAQNPPKRSVVFVSFTGEELGLLGSNYFVNNSPIDLNKVSLMINLDMVGRLKNNILYAIGTGSAEQLDGIISELDMNDSLSITKSESPIGSSDQTSFYIKQVPSIMFFTGVHQDYHRPTDDWDKINYEGMDKVVNFISKLIYEVGNRNEKLKYVKTSGNMDPNNTSGRGMGGIKFGIIPNFETSKEGLKIAGTTPNTPAEKAGLKENDIIIQIDDYKVMNIQDFMGVLRDHYKPGDEVKIKFLRDGKINETKVKLEAR